MCEISSRLTRKKPEECCSDASIVDFEQDLLAQNLLTGPFDKKLKKITEYITITLK